MTWQTHAITNQFDELKDYNLFATDTPLKEALARAGAQSFVESLDQYGAKLGQATTYALADQANRYTPEFKPFDSRGRRLDQVEFHPSWHELMALYRGQGLISLPF
ncbi:MAG: DNA alkylation response protein, partial [Burkholderiales bacterium]|nr:DNA alkylation response protein [Burkholderiales bacterium]